MKKGPGTKDAPVGDSEYKPLLDWLQLRSIPMDRCHTSGHAAASAIKHLIGSIDAPAVIPIHTAHAADFGDMLGVRAIVPDDGQWVCA